MRVLFVLSSRRAFRWRTYKHTELNYAGVSYLDAVRGELECVGVFLFFCLFIFFSPAVCRGLPGCSPPFLVVITAGGKATEQGRPGSKTWRRTVPAEGSELEDGRLVSSLRAETMKGGQGEGGQVSGVSVQEKNSPLCR